MHIERDFSQADAIPAKNPLQPAELLAPPALYDIARDNNKTGDRVGLVQSLLLLAGIPASIYLWRRNRNVAVMLGAATLLGLSCSSCSHRRPIGCGVWAALLLPGCSIAPV